jgi:uncharacterized protein (TIGR03790 family)
MPRPTSAKPCAHQSERDAFDRFLAVDRGAALGQRLTFLRMVLAGLAFTALLACTEATGERASSGAVGGAGGSSTVVGNGGAMADGGAGGGEPFAGPPVVSLPRTGIDRDQLAVLVNDQDEQSLAVAAYYQQARGIPEENLIRLSFEPSTVMTTAAFAGLFSDLQAQLSDDIQALAITWTQPHRVGCMSVTSAFALGYDDKYCNTGGGNCALTAPVAYANSRSVQPFTDFGIRPAMALAGTSKQNVFALIDRGVASDDTFPTGRGYFVRTTDVARSVRWPAFVDTLAIWDDPGGLALSYIDNADGKQSNFIEQQNDVLFYMTGLTTVPSIETNTFLPGAVADHLTSFGGKIPQGTQMNVLRWIEAGATASYGTVVEPCNYPNKFPEPRLLLSNYYRGQTVVEAYYKSVFWPGEGLFVGEPLARPWGGSQVNWQDGTLSIVTTLLEPYRSYALQAAEAQEGPYETVRSLAIFKHQRLTITLDKAYARFYRLVAL